MRQVRKRFGDQVVIIAFPTQEFGLMEHGIEDAHKLKEFAAKHGPTDLVLLQTGRLGDRSGWWAEVVPEWNFRGKWLVDRGGKRTTTETAQLYEDISFLVSKPRPEEAATA